MFLQFAADARMVEVLSLNDLFNPNHAELVGRFHAGEELQDPEKFQKRDLIFPSGEALPECWINSHYRED